MHDGGTVQPGTGNLALGADLSFAEGYKKQWRQLPRVQGRGAFQRRPAAGQIWTDDGQNGQATFLKYASAGEAPQPSEGQFDLRMLGLFAYDGKLNAGQKLPGSSFRLKIGKDAPVGASPAPPCASARRRWDSRSRWTRRWASSPATRSPTPQFRSHHGFVPGA